MTVSSIREAALVTCMVTALAVGACDTASNHAATERTTDAAAPEWVVATEPALSIGVVEGDEPYQLHQVVGAVRLDDGRIAIMNAGSGELRIYTGSGEFLSAHGRPGEGPGEFRAAARMHLIHDTIMVYDARLQRLSLHDPSGAFTGNRALPSQYGRFALDEWLYDRSWIVGPPFGKGRAPVKEAVSRLPLPDTVELFRYVLVSPYGQLWVRQPRAPGDEHTDWQIFDMQAELIGHARLPALFEIMQFGPDYLLGRSRDSLDIEYVQLLTLDSPLDRPRPFTFASASDGDTISVQPDSTLEERLREMRGTLRMLNMAQEIFYSTPENQYSYATRIDQVAEHVEVPPTIAVRIISANERGWIAVAMDRSSGTMCGLAIGAVVPIGWVPGVVSCT